MARWLNAGNVHNPTPLKAKEVSKIDHRVESELHALQCKMAKIGGPLNIIAGIILILALYNHANHWLLYCWLAILVLSNALNMFVVSYYTQQTLSRDEIQRCRKKYHLSLALLTLTWGFIAILYPADNIHYQFYIITYLLMALVGFGFGTITDFTASAISIICITIPYLAYRLFLGLQAIVTATQAPELNLVFIGGLLIISIFLFIACYLGYTLIKKFFKLNFINLVISKKLANMNRILEYRVKERTLQLEKSLKNATYLATHDTLTQLPNSRLLLEYMRIAIRTAHIDHQPFAVIFFTINEIEKINDGLGHKISDYVIRTIARRLKIIFHSSKKNTQNNFSINITLSRKDEFILVMKVLNDDHIKEVISLLFSGLEKLIYTKQQTIRLTGSVGVSIYPHDGNDIKSLLMNADAAMLKSKQNGGNCINYYKPEINAYLSKQLEMDTDLHAAVQNKELFLNYQPIIDLKSGQICGMEALLRWKHPTLGFIPPTIFIQLAEANGLIIPLGRWVIETACHQIKEWHMQGFKNLTIAINLSAKQLHNTEILNVTAAVLKEINLNPKFIEFELTETEAFNTNYIPIIQQLKMLGIGLSIDDFGTGFSGLTNLKQFRIDKIKIDKSFIDDVTTNADSNAIVTNIIALAKQLHINVVAEGVENKSQLEFLQDNDCDMIQGYYFSPPISAEKFTDLLVNHPHWKLDSHE